MCSNSGLESSRIAERTQVLDDGSARYQGTTVVGEIGGLVGLWLPRYIVALNGKC